MTRRTATVVDLFSGAGGLSLGFHAAGARILAAVDASESAGKTFRHNFSRLCGFSTLAGTLSAISSLDKAGVELNASVAVTPTNLEFVSNASEILAKRGIQQFGFNLLRGTFVDSRLPATARKPFFEASAIAIIENFKHSQNKNADAFFLRRLRALRDRESWPARRGTAASFLSRREPAQQLFEKATAQWCC